MTEAHALLVATLRDERRAVLATLVRFCGDLQVAEDAVQDAIVRALETWPRTGTPPNPTAWLMLTARRRAIDILRREGGRPDKEQAAMTDLPGETAADDGSVVSDDLLRLVFTCCHPTLSVEAQVALSLRTLCGLTTAETARALLVPEPTMLRRLTRAKDKIRRAGIPYRVPEAAELPARLRPVVATVYLLFNEGYSATAGADAIRPTLSAEAVRLGRLLHGLMPDEPTVTGLLALMLLHEARRPARTDAAGRLVLLEDQDPSLWQADLVHEGVTLVGDGLRRTPTRPDAMVVQAAIAACHVLPVDGRTDWRAVVSWYDVLLTVNDTPVVRLNRAAAVGERDGPAAGLVEVDAVDGLGQYAPWHAARAVLLSRLERTDEAVTAGRRAFALDLNAGHREQLSRLLPALADPETGT